MTNEKNRRRAPSIEDLQKQIRFLEAEHNGILAELQRLRAEQERTSARLSLQSRVEDALRLSRKRLQFFIDQAPVAIAMFDRQLRYESASARWRSDFGLGRRPLRGLSHYEVFPEISPRWKEIHRRCLAGETLRSEEDRFERADGRVQWLRWEVQPWHDAGEVGGLIIFSEDITARKQMELELRRSKEEAEEANQTKSHFLANVSHELRTPLTVVIGALELLRTIETAAEREQLMEMADSCAHRLLGIIDDLLDISRIEAGRLHIETHTFDLRACVRQATEMFAAAAREKGLAFFCRVDPKVPEQVDGDPARLWQVLVNLVGNAVKFTETGEVMVQVDRREEELVFCVRDTGIGIPAEVQDRLFKSFSQVDASLTRRYGGTGLGLSISRELVEMMGGKIRVESEPGRGSTFVVTLPCREPDARS